MIYFAIFLFFIGLGTKLLLAAKGDYYLDKTGIHFVRDDKSYIAYADIEKSKWRERNYSVNNMPVKSVTTMRVNGRRVKIYNLPLRLYHKHMKSDNVYELVHEQAGHDDGPANQKSKRSLVHTIIPICLGVVGACAGISFLLFMSYTVDHGGSAINAGNVDYLLNHPDVPHYLADHGVFTQVSYSVWVHAYVLERISMTLIPVVVLGGFAYAIYSGISANRTRRVKGK